MNKETSEIAKLTERIAKDPKSKLFVPLAEEYKKAGDIEMAIHVLTEGLKNNTGYVTARSFLGRLLIEKGDLAGAQKEFADVVKAIPDNLMAQRKLGDIYALQNNPAEALKHYEVVLSLNPKDSETTMLITEAKAGHDLKPLLSVTAAAGDTKKQEPAHTVSAGAHTALSAAAFPSAQPPVQQEEAEEVLHVEPLLETAASTAVEEQRPAGGQFDFLNEPANKADSEHGEEATAADSFSFGEPAGDGDQKVVQEHESQIPDIFAAPAEPASGGEAAPASDVDLAAALPSFSEPVAELEEPARAGEHQELEISAADPFGIGETAEETEVPVLEAPALEPVDPLAEPFAETEPGKQADDFTTDTLAELYITQGFFEKAIDIYERMLADRPDSQGLKDKLAKVRAMAAAAESNGETTAESAAEVSTPPEETSVSEKTSFSMPLPDAAPRLDDWELPVTKAAPAAEEQEPSTAPRPAKPFDLGFEPREYVPPDAVLRKVSAAEEEKTHAADGSKAEEAAAGKKQALNKKEVVDRLESWLKSIRKET